MRLLFKKISAIAAVVVSTALSGCAVVPVPIPVSTSAERDFCPPGQAKKGRCVDQGGGFCPPGQAKKGAC